MRIFISVFLCLILCGCNSVYLKPHTLDKNAIIYTPRGGYSIRRSVKQVMEKRGYKTHTGNLVSEKTENLGDGETFRIPKSTRYVVYVREREETFRPIWCIFNGFWWWNFNLSISDRTNGNEILSWRGRGCANSSLRKLNRILDELETSTPTPLKSTKSTQEITITTSNSTSAND